MNDTPGTHADKTRQDDNELDTRIDRDLKALSTRSRQDPPSLSETIHTLAGESPGRQWEERLMALTGFFKSRPRVATFAAVAVLAAALLVVPFSYQKVVGHQVSLVVAGPGVNQTLMQGIASEFKETLDVDEVKMMAEAGETGTEYTLVAETRGKKGAPAIAQAFARSLTAKGYTARSSSSPIKEKVNGSVYAMVMSNTIEIDVDGKTAEQLEAEIVAALTASGIPNAEVSVTLGDNQMKIEVKAMSEGPIDGDATDDHAQIVLTSGGEVLGGGGESVEVGIKKIRDENGERLIVEVTKNGQTATATIQDAGSLSDDDLAEAVRAQLAAQGVDYEVSCLNGRVKVSSPASDEGSDVRPTTWGKLKQKMNDDN